ncbi:hypothetical protein BGT96224_A20321 [Blumeria graminis f. sp. tritici 96224]|nr:hypothetical protein BGT96224_A20321 [Blumeria graminis f. sp. tritici 96224]
MLGQLKRQLDEILKETQVAIESDDEK